ncbi:hypothetical protein DFH08DRAFT_927436 [Mycena albidolilacea]|uniref:Uncharacterized protein n=1 Tax=Mycena albidolilacea TaxID=1033008 RepID=A0AAD6Z504_9AGAR|nr:hypothetical protein DFH08DRAFT_927436 [Mycena albidolilacea]
MDISSEWVILHRIALLTRIEPLWFHCCPNSCIAYTLQHSNLSHFPYPDCREARYTPAGTPRRLFCYLPLIPRLQGLFSNPKTVEELLYRHRYQSRHDEVSDNLRKKKVTVDGRELAHCYFSGKYDIALGVCMDSYLLVDRRRKGPSATPILLQNYNIRPAVRTHLSREICVGDSHSFLFPFEDECVLLAAGIPTYDCVSAAVFDLHAYTIFGMGDILAVEKLLNTKGHNGIRNISGGDTIYYIPLTHPDLPGEPRRSWNPTNLPLRHHDDFIDITNRLQTLKLVKDRKQLTFHEGINGLPAPQRVGSMDFARSSPWDIMHLFFENIVPNLVKLWSGKFKHLDVGSEDYEIDSDVWDEIWAETVDAVEHIPAQFAWCFWFVYLVPILLKGRFKHSKYHDHLCELTYIIKTCIAFTITHAEIADLRRRIIAWMRTYECYYYQYQEDRLSTCTLTVHGLIHDGQPGLSSWNWYCGFLKGALRSKQLPWANMNNTILHGAYLEQLSAQFDVEKELASPLYRVNGLPSTEQRFDLCSSDPQMVL